jgi:endogenous inhibitor of DNA gyrase (YacG/DUF329 family)
MAFNDPPLCSKCGKPVKTIYMFYPHGSSREENFLVIKWNGATHYISKRDVMRNRLSERIRICHECLSPLSVETMLPLIKHLLREVDG